MNLLETEDFNGGFFSCCSCRLGLIIDYIEYYNKLPDEVNSLLQYEKYKPQPDMDVTFDFFENYNNVNINIEIDPEKKIELYHLSFQFNDYKKQNMKDIIPIVRKYFTPSKKILSYYDTLLQKYNIDLDNCIGIYYRGTDKATETDLDSFESYYDKLNEIIYKNEKENKNIQILLQSDSAHFLDFMREKCTNKNIIIISENETSYTDIGIHNENNYYNNYIHIHNLFATFLIISKCKYIICSSCNCSMWIMYFREKLTNVYQNLNKEWL